MRRARVRRFGVRKPTKRIPIAAREKKLEKFCDEQQKISEREKIYFCEGISCISAKIFAGPLLMDSRRFLE